MSTDARSGGAVAFVLKGYPRLSETFIAQEIRGLEKLGLDIRIVSLRPPREEQRHPVHREIEAAVTYLPERLREEPVRVVSAVCRQVVRPRFWRAVNVWLKDLRLEPTIDRVRRFGQALVMAGELDSEVDRLHAHFLHTPASVTRYTSILTGLPWTCSAHARDIWTIGDAEKSAKLRDMEWLVTCTEAGRAHLAELSPSPSKVALVYHGIDLDRFAPPQSPRSEHDGSDAQTPVLLLSVGRPVEKKGYDLLLDALSKLPDTLHWRFRHIGDGALTEQLMAQARSLAIDDRVDWYGARTQDQVIASYREADMFVLPCRIAADGDRDGLPNVLLEAQTQGLVCVSTQVSGVPELITDGESGLLVPPDDTDALVTALTRLIQAPALRQRLGDAGLRKVRTDFSHDRGLQELARRFGLVNETTEHRASS